MRVARGVSQEILALDAQIDRTYVSRLERGMENPTVVVLDRLVAALGCSIFELFAVPARGDKFPQPLRKGRRRRVE